MRAAAGMRVAACARLVVEGARLVVEGARLVVKGARLALIPVLWWVAAGVRMLPFAEVEKMGAANKADHIPPKPSDLATIMYTSGTTVRAFQRATVCPLTLSRALNNGLMMAS